MSSIFLSHNHADKPFARKLAADLRRSGHNVWIDEAEINIGDSLIEKIRDGLDDVDYVAALLSSNSIESEWVKKELDIASNREIDEKRVIVLPLLLEKVPLPGFLKGKFYGDFCDKDQYQDTFDLLLRKLAPPSVVAEIQDEELELLKAELDAAKNVIKTHESEIKRASSVALKSKSDKLKKEIEADNKLNPHFATINNTYAFEAIGIPITLGYLLHCMRKAEERGSHQIETAITMDNKWDDASLMLEAFSDFLKANNS